MPITPLIGLIGKKRVGKDSFASALTSRYDYQRVAFADPLKEASYFANPIMGTFSLMPEGHDHPVTQEWRLQEVIDTLGWDTAKDLIPEVRRFLEDLGTNGIRALDEGFWLRIGLGRIDSLGSRGVPAVVTDARFPNEADAIRDRGGLIVRILRDNPELDQGGHVSNTALDDYAEDFTVPNDGTLADLQDAAYIVAEQVARITSRTNYPRRKHGTQN
jgi:hypothetical protein